MVEDWLALIDNMNAALRDQPPRRPLRAARMVRP